MSRTEKALVVILRVTGAVELAALLAAVMPFACMAAIHEWLGVPGQLFDSPITGYLTRSLSLFWAANGTVLMGLSFGVRRHLAAIRLLATVGFVFGASLLVLDLALGMPASWTAGEGPFIMTMCAVVLWLVGRIQQEPEEAES